MGNEESKVQLSKEEIHVLSERDFFVSKKRVTQKVYEQLAEVRAAIKTSEKFLQISFPAGTDFSSGKISKGENYLGWPFIILDFPRNFSKEHLLAFRTMIWWGNFASATLIRTIRNAKEAKQVAGKLSIKYGNGIFVCVNESPWHHHFGKENYVPLDSLSEDELTDYFFKNSFVKVSRKIPLTQINKLTNFSVDTFELFASLL